MKKISNFRQEVMDKLKDQLPHGSGINGKWHIEAITRGKYHASNFFEAMNETGMYCHSYDFTITYKYDRKTQKFEMTHFNFHNCYEYACCGYDMRNYLEETLYDIN